MTKEILLTGTCKYARIFIPDAKFGEPRYSINLYLDATSRAIFQQSGLRLRPKTDADGVYVTFRRDHNPKIYNEQEIAGTGGKPIILDAQGQPMDKFIGDGSEVEIVVSVYDTRMGPGHRLKQVKVVNFVEYKPRDTAVTTPKPALPFE